MGDNMLKIELVRTLKGEPKRLKITTDNPATYKAIFHSFIGSSYVTDNIITIPPERNNLQKFMEIYPDAEVEFGTKLWYDNWIKDTQAAKELKRLPNAEQLKKYPAYLHEYQKIDIEFMYKVKRVQNHNDMGLGKTLEAIELIRKVNPQNSVLIVCPASLKLNWKAEFTKWYPEFSIAVVSGNAKQRSAIMNSNKNLIINYEQLKSHFNALRLKDWGMIFYDEAHKLKNYKDYTGGKTQSLTFGGAAKKLTAEYIIMMTGSPILNNAGDLWRPLNILYPKEFPAYWQFVDKYCETTLNYWSGGKDIIGNKNEDKLKSLMDGFTIRRSKDDALDLPGKIPISIAVELSTTQKNYYERFKKRKYLTDKNNKVIVQSSNAAETLIRLRQITLSPALFGLEDADSKFEMLLELIEKHAGKQIVVFSYFKEYIKIIHKKLTDLHYKCNCITGEVRINHRQAVVDDFHKNKFQILLGTIGAMGVGLNLYNAHIGVFTDRYYVPAMMEQAEDRMYRQGQKERVLIYYLDAENTVDDHIKKILWDKNIIIEETRIIDKIYKEEFNEV